MKFALVVASGVHQGKEVAVPGPSLVIGRADDCHLRPASPAISNRHCEVFVQNAAVFLRDLGSTNGTLLNDKPVTDTVAVKQGDRLKVGPLDFTIKLIPAKSDSTPLPDSLKAVSPPGRTGSSTTLKSVAKPSGSSPAVPAAAPTPSAPAATTTTNTNDDDMAAMLLEMDSDDPEIPGGSTVMELPAVDAAALAKAAEEKKVLTQPDSSSAARDLLFKMMQRPRR